MKKYCPVCDTTYESGDTCPEDGTTLMVKKQAEDLLLGNVVKGNYRIMTNIGQERTGTLYRAVSLKDDQVVIVKVLDADAQKTLVKRFFREASLLAELDHPNIVHTLEYGNTADGLVFLVMELLAGDNLRQAMESRYPLPIGDFARICQEMCAGVQAAHEKEVIHRDLKPEAVFLCKRPGSQEIVKILDFGLAKSHQSGVSQLTEESTLLGTTSYIAPELITGSAEPSPQSDIYSLGSLLYYLATGHNAYQGPSARSILSQQTTEPPPPFDPKASGYPAELQDIVQKAMSIDPAGRYSSAQEMAAALAEVLKTDPPEKVNPAAREEIPKKGNGETHIGSGSKTQNFWVTQSLASELIDAAVEKANQEKAQEPADQKSSVRLALDEKTPHEKTPHEKTPDKSEQRPAKQAPFKHQASGIQPTAPDKTTLTISTQPELAAQAQAAKPGESATPSSKKPIPLAPIIGAAVFAVVAIGIMLVVAAGRDGSKKPPIPATGNSHPITKPKPVIPGVSDKEVTLGMTGAFSGSNKELGRSFRLGINTCIQAVNTAGGIAGRQLNLVANDDGYEPDQAQKNIKSLIKEQKVFATVGNMGTATAIVTMPFANANRRLFFGAFTGAEFLQASPPKRHVFNLRPRTSTELETIVEHLVKTQKVPVNQIALFAQNDTFGSEGRRSLLKALTRAGLTKPDELITAYYRKNSTEVEEAAEKMLRHREQIAAIIMVGTYRPVARFVEQIRRKKMDPILATVSFVGSGALAQEFSELDAKLGDGVLVTEVVPSPQAQLPAVIQYQADLKAHYPEEQASTTSLEGYLVARLLTEGLRRVGEELTTPRLIQTLEKMGEYDLGIGVPCHFSAKRHHCSDRVWLTELSKDGTYSDVPLPQ